MNSVSNPLNLWTFEPLEPLEPFMKLPILPTTVIGSYSMPEWLERAKNDYLSRRLSRRDLDEMHDAVRKAAIKDQEIAGIDIVTDGELQRDNMIDYFTERLPGVQVDLGSKRFYYDFYESVVRSKLATGSLGLVEEVRFVKRFTERAQKISVSGPHTLVKRIRNQFYPTEEAFALDLARSLNFELKELARAGATELQIDEPYYSGLSRGPPVGRQGDQRRRRGRRRARDASHLLRQPLRETVVRGQLPVPLPHDSPGEGARPVARVRAARRRRPGAVPGIQGAVHARAGRDRRQDAGSRAADAGRRPDSPGARDRARSSAS